jgi:hypothetical protein
MPCCTAPSVNLRCKYLGIRKQHQTQQLFDCQKSKRYPKIMKVETTITIEADLLEQVDRAAKDFRNRSEVFEIALQEYLPKLNQKPQKRKLTREEEIKLINRYADEHREEILENLEYQVEL